jgi:hypothetical protein
MEGQYRNTQQVISVIFITCINMLFNILNIYFSIEFKCVIIDRLHQLKIMAVEGDMVLTIYIISECFWKYPGIIFICWLLVMESANVKWQGVRRIQIVKFVDAKSLLFNWSDGSWTEREREREGERCYLGKNTERNLLMLLWRRSKKYVIFSSVVFGWIGENNYCGSMFDRNWQFSVSVHFLYASLCVRLNAELIITPRSDSAVWLWWIVW